MQALCEGCGGHGRNLVAAPPAQRRRGSTVARRTTWLRLAGAFVGGFVGLALEIACTRIISFGRFFSDPYSVIALALLGLGAASTVLALSKRLRSLDSLVLLRRSSPVVAIAGLVPYAVVARLGTDTSFIWAGSASPNVRAERVKTLQENDTVVAGDLGPVFRVDAVDSGELRVLHHDGLWGSSICCAIHLTPAM